MATIKRQLLNSAQANHNLLAGSVQAASVGTPLPPACLAGRPLPEGVPLSSYVWIGCKKPFSALLSLTHVFFLIPNIKKKKSAILRVLDPFSEHSLERTPTPRVAARMSHLQVTSSLQRPRGGGGRGWLLRDVLDDSKTGFSLARIDSLESRRRSS